MTLRTTSRANSGTSEAYPRQKPRHSRGPPPRRGAHATGAGRPHHARATSRAPMTVPHRTTMPDAGAAASAGVKAKIKAKTNTAAAAGAEAEAAHVSAGATEAVTAPSAGAARAATARATVPAKCANETITRMVARRYKIIERDATITTARTATETPPTTAITATAAGAGAGADVDADAGVGEERTHQCTTAMRPHYRKHHQDQRSPHPHPQAQKGHRPIRT